MRNFRLIFAAVIPLASAIAVSADDIKPVIAPNVRKEALAKADALLSVKPLGLPANANDPFHSQAFAEASGHPIHTTDTSPKVAGPKTEHDILAGIAAGLKPSGNFIIGGQEVLLFGEKRVKPGTTLTINFEGAEYTVEITAINHTSFTLRLNREEFTRPIK
ncbi:MAG TPA: hypothetical protein VHD32_02245 [Candidatus Didemnitutus sp.]|nr:hypothetical protein [Candidatus Didemnitutus sp.]